MFGIDSSELLVIAVVALVVIGPKDLPRVMQVVGRWVGRARGMVGHLRSGIDEVIRQAELEEMEKRWAAENARIMAQHPQIPDMVEAQTIVQDPVVAPAEYIEAPAASIQPDPAEAPHNKPA